MMAKMFHSDNTVFKWVHKDILESFSFWSICNEAIVVVITQLIE